MFVSVSSLASLSPWRRREDRASEDGAPVHVHRAALVLGVKVVAWNRVREILTAAIQSLLCCVLCRLLVG